MPSTCSVAPSRLVCVVLHTIARRLTVATAGAAIDMTLLCTCVLCEHVGSCSPVVLSVCSDTFPNNDTKECEQCHDECIGCCDRVSACVHMTMSVCMCVCASRDVSLSLPLFECLWVLTFCPLCCMQGPFQCKACRNFRIVHNAAGDGVVCHNGTECVSACPGNYYADGMDCKLCNELCVGGCTGPGNFVGQGGCNACDFVNFDQNDTQVHMCGGWCAVWCAGGGVLVVVYQ